MVITRISTFNTHQQTMGNATQVQGRLFELQKQISSGLKTESFQGLYGEIEAFTALDDKMSRTEQFLVNNSIISTRTTLMSQSIESVIDVAAETRNLLLTRRSGTGNQNLGFEQQLESKWQTIASELNVTVEGRYLFGGIRTDRPPVDTDVQPFLHNEEGIPEANFYQGSNQNSSIRLQENYDVTISTRADDPAIQKVYAAFALAREGHIADDDAKLEAAYDLMSDGLEDLSLMQVDMANVNATVIDVADRQERQMLYWKGIKDSLISTDIVSATSEVALNEGILQATFQVFARINSLNLADFLR